MKLEQQQQAQHLYFQTDLSKTQIADALGISRRSLHYWIRDNNWERLKMNAEHIPSCIAENCYYIMGHLTDSLLSERRADNPVTPQEVNMLYKLTLTINKLKARSTTNESMETLYRLSDNINKKDPELAIGLQPHINEYIATRAAANKGTFMPERLNSSGYISKSEQDAEEERLDQLDLEAWAEEARRNGEPQESGQPVTKEPSLQPTPQTAPNTYATSPSPRPNDVQSGVASERVGERSIPREKFSSLIRKQLRGSSTTGPSKNLRKQPVAA
jgi:transposase-like protein